MGEKLKEVVKSMELDINQYPEIDVMIEDLKKNHKELEQKLIPKFESLLDEREHRKRRLVIGLHLFAHYKFDEGVAGHITVRDPIEIDSFWVNPFGVYFKSITVDKLIRVDSKGNIVEGNGTLNKAAFAIHSSIHKMRPDVIAAAHSHSMYGRTWSTLGRLLDPINQDACAFYQDHVLFDSYTGVVFGELEGLKIAQLLGNTNSAILQNHGLLTTGSSVDSCIWRFISMERCCQCQIMAESVGKPIKINHDIARLTQVQVGSSFACWFSFQNELGMITTMYPYLNQK